MGDSIGASINLAEAFPSLSWRCRRDDILEEREACEQHDRAPQINLEVISILLSLATELWDACSIDQLCFVSLLQVDSE